MSEHDGEGLPRGPALSARDAAFRADPHAVYDRLRAHAPLYVDDAYGRRLLTRHADVRAVLRAKEFGVDARKSLPGSYMRRVAGTGVAESAGDAAYEPPLVLLDDPGHRRLRGLVGKAFTPRAVEAMRPRIHAIANALVDDLGRDSEIDFIARYAGPLPTLVIAEMLGLAAGHGEDLKRWSDAILQGYDPERDAATQRALRAGYLALSALLREVVAARRREPRADLISALVQAQEADDRLTDLEIISLCTQLIVAGNVTTTDLMGNGLHALLTHPEQLARLRAAPTLIDAAIEEILRYDCPLTETARIALDDTTVGGCPVRRGETLTVSLAAANHDPARFEQPHRFELARAENPHLGFGSGVHVCLGAPLARLEGSIGLQTFIERFPALSLLERSPVRRRLPFFRGFAALPLRLHRAAPAART
jgi:cytochrome P450